MLKAVVAFVVIWWMTSWRV